MAERYREYECCTLYRPDVEPEALDALVTAASDLITSHGGELGRVDRWNKRLLAYPIRNYTEGFYVIYRFSGTPQVLPDLNYHLRYNDDCLRYMVLDYTEKERKRRKRLGGKKAAAAAAAAAGGAENGKA